MLGTPGVNADPISPYANYRDIAFPNRFSNRCQTPLRNEKLANTLKLEEESKLPVPFFAWKSEKPSPVRATSPQTPSLCDTVSFKATGNDRIPRFRESVSLKNEI